MKRYHTQSSSRKVTQIALLAYLGMGLLALLGLLNNLATCLFLEGIVLFCILIVLIVVRKKVIWLLDFENHVLILTNGYDKYQYRIDDLCFEDYHFKQSPRQQAKNTCDLRIGKYPFGIYDVPNCAQLRQFLADVYQATRSADAKIVWLSPDEGGRKTLPKTENGYYPIVCFGDEALDPKNAWSVVVHVKEQTGERETLATIRPFSEEMPFDPAPGETFRLYEGPNLVATGVVLQKQSEVPSPSDDGENDIP